MVGAYCYAELGLLIRKVVLIMMMTINTKQLWIENLHQMIFDNNLLFCYSLEEITLISLTLWGRSSDLSGSLSITLSQGCHLKVGHLVVSKIKLSSCGDQKSHDQIVGGVHHREAVHSDHCHNLHFHHCSNHDYPPDEELSLIILIIIIIMIRLWAECIIVRPCTATIVSLTFAKYSVKLLFPECDPPDERLASSTSSSLSSSSASSSLA